MHLRPNGAVCHLCGHSREPPLLSLQSSLATHISRGSGYFLLSFAFTLAAGTSNLCGR